ncbi:MAG: NADH-quinone oxidoreductase subunit N [Desulfomonile tiedjei]|nr:NADH-quinone oxidoreductase subunit N [Desulfomonile tiedjei]
MNAAEITVLSPIIVLSAASVLIMMVIAFYRHHLLTAVMAAVGFVLALVAIGLVAPVLPMESTPLLVMDGYAVFFMALTVGAGLAVVLMSYGYLNGREGHQEEYYVLILLATVGASVLASSNHFASFFLGLEILGVSLYVLIAYPRRRTISIEAGVKYLILAATSDAFLLFGMALIYSQTGSLQFQIIASASADGNPAFLLVGTALLLTGIGFKLSLVPFHMWTPDVYEGAAAPVAGFVATVSKGAVFALLLRYFIRADIGARADLVLVLGIIALASMIAGNLLALLQNNVKRILAYSSIAHMGYLLVALLASGPLALSAASYYLVAYFITTLGAFGVITALSSGERDTDSLDEYRGLGWQRPWLAGVFAAMLLSLAGIPLTAGFIGKFYVLAAGVGSSLWTLVTALVITSVIGLFYYLRVIVTMYAMPAASRTVPASPARETSLAAGVVLLVLTVLLVWLGVYPLPLMQLIETTVARLS